MKFGKEFKTHLEETLPEWRDKFLCYKLLKKLLKHFPSETAVSLLAHPNFHRHHDQRPISSDSDAIALAAVDGAAVGRDRQGEQRSLTDLQEWFVRILNEELEKFNDFYVDKEEEFVIRLQELKERSTKGGIFTSESEFSEEMMDIRKEFVTIHGEMVLLKNYSSLNFAGLVKILKKYDKRTGELLRLPFTQLALNQPFFTTDPLTRLVRDCEANLELLFPLEAEVVESNTAPQSKTNLPQNDITTISREPFTAIGEETVDIYRSTIAAMKAIEGLQKASSTYNPLSFGTLFRRVNDDSTGSITAENSDSNSSAMIHGREDADNEDANSK